MRTRIHQDKSIDELKADLLELQRKYNSLEQLYTLTINDNHDQEIALSKLNRYTLELSNLSPNQSVEEAISKMIKDLTGAKATLFSDYNSATKTLTVQHVELEHGLLEKVVHLLGKQVKKTIAYLSDENYEIITRETIGIRYTLSDASFGSVPPLVSAAIQKLLGIDRFIGIAYVIEGKLYGTSLLAMTKNQPDPPRQVLENMVYLAAVTLRRKQAERALKESQTQMEALLQTIPDMMFLQDQNGVYIAYHATEEAKLYAPSEAFIGKRVSEVLPPETGKEFEAVIRKAVETKKVQNFEYSLNLPAGMAYFESRTIAFNDERILSLVRDITERKKNELKIQEQNRELKKLNEDKDRFMSILAHDLKSPFNSILGFLDLLIFNLHKYDKPKIEGQLKLIKHSAEQFYQLLQSLLLWIRAQSGKMTFEPIEIRLSDLNTKILEELELNARSKNITIVDNTENIKVFADIEMLKTVLRNLISNAIKFTGKDGRIELYTEDQPTHHIVVVSDNGIGIESGTEESIFEMSTTHKSGTSGEQGTGLGLFLCRELIEKHGGTIWVESQEEQGSKFKFTLPKKCPETK